MKRVVNVFVLLVFTVTTFLILNWLLDRHWNWEFIGYCTVGFFASVVALTIGGLTANALLSLFMNFTSYGSEVE